ARPRRAADRRERHLVPPGLRALPHAREPRPAPALDVQRERSARPRLARVQARGLGLRPHSHAPRGERAADTGGARPRRAPRRLVALQAPVANGTTFSAPARASASSTRLIASGATSGQRRSISPTETKPFSLASHATSGPAPSGSSISAVELTHVLF